MLALSKLAPHHLYDAVDTLDRQAVLASQIRGIVASKFAVHLNVSLAASTDNIHRYVDVLTAPIVRNGPSSFLRKSHGGVLTYPKTILGKLPQLGREILEQLCAELARRFSLGVHQLPSGVALSTRTIHFFMRSMSMLAW